MPEQSEQSFAALERDLVELGRALAPDPPRADLVQAVMARVTDGAGGPQPVPVAAGRESHRYDRSRLTRRLAAAAAVLIALVVALVPPVRAAVLELLRIGGVTVQEHPAPTVPPTPLPTRSDPLPSGRSSSPTSPGEGERVSLAEARASLGIPIAAPRALGPPDSVMLLEGRHVVQLTWHGTHGATRLDVFAGSPDYGYLKQVWTELTPTRVGSFEAVWIGAPHLLRWVDRSGASQPDPARVAGPTLVWMVPTPAGGVTYRLEGPTTLAEAMAIATSAR